MATNNNNQEEEETLVKFRHCFVGGLPEQAAPTVTCDPEVCRMKAGICVDCTHCSDHCVCNVASLENSSSIVRGESIKGVNSKRSLYSPPKQEDDNNGSRRPKLG